MVRPDAVAQLLVEVLQEDEVVLGPGGPEVQRVAWRLSVDVLGEAGAAERLEVEGERVDVGLVGEVLPIEVRRRPQRDEQLVDRPQVLHLLDRDPEQVARVRVAAAGDRLVGRLEREGAVEVLGQQGVLDLGRLAEQPEQLEVGVGEVAHDRRRGRLAGGQAQRPLAAGGRGGRAGVLGRGGAGVAAEEDAGDRQGGALHGRGLEEAAAPDLRRALEHPHPAGPAGPPPGACGLARAHEPALPGIRPRPRAIGRPPGLGRRPRPAAAGPHPTTQSRPHLRPPDRSRCAISIPSPG